MEDNTIKTSIETAITNSQLRDKISKRICGIVFLSASFIMRGIIFGYAIVKPIADSSTAMEVASGLAYTGLFLLLGDAAQQAFKGFSNK